MGILSLDNLACLEKLYNFSVFYCLCYAKDKSTDMSEDQVAEERYPDLYEEEDIGCG